LRNVVFNQIDTAIGYVFAIKRFCCCSTRSEKSMKAIEVNKEMTKVETMSLDWKKSLSTIVVFPNTLSLK